MANKINTLSLLAVVSAAGISLCSALPAQAATAFLGSSKGDFGTVDTDTGAFTSIGNTVDVEFFDIATYNATLGYGVTGRGDFYSINLADASTTLIGNIGRGAFINGLGFDNSGNLFGTGGNQLYSIDLGTGVANSVATIRGFRSSGDIAFDGSKFFATSRSRSRGRRGRGGRSDTLFSFDSEGNNLTKIGSIGFEDVYGLTYQEGTLFGFTDNKKILTINTTTGKGTKIAKIDGIEGRVFGAAPQQEVPEPASILGTAAAFGMACLLRKKKNGSELKEKA